MDSRFCELSWEMKISWSKWVDKEKGNATFGSSYGVTINRGPVQSGFH